MDDNYTTGDVVATYSGNEEGAYKSELYVLAQEYFTKNPDVSPKDTSPDGIISAYMQELKKQQSQPRQKNSAALDGEQSFAQQSNSQSRGSDDLFGSLFDALIRASIHEAMFHHHHCACPHHRFAHLSFGLPPVLAGCHRHFCSRVDAHKALNRIKVHEGSYDVGHGIAEVIKGNTGTGITEALSGGLKVASVWLDKRGRR